MDLMAARRKLLMTQHGLDTSPKIVEYGAYWERTNEGKIADENWCITEWYAFNPQKSGSITIVGYIGGSDNTNHTFQYHTEGRTWRDWYYFNVGDVEGERTIQNAAGTRVLQEISFSIFLNGITNAYAYVKETGQIFFAGENSIYYGHKNISELE